MEEELEFRPLHQIQELDSKALMKQGSYESTLMLRTEAKVTGHRVWMSFLTHRQKEHHNQERLRQMLHGMAHTMSPMQGVRFPFRQMKTTATTVETMLHSYLNQQGVIPLQVVPQAPIDLDVRSSLEG